MYRFSPEGREIAVISLFAAPFARVGDKGQRKNLPVGSDVALAVEN